MKGNSHNKRGEITRLEEKSKVSEKLKTYFAENLSKKASLDITYYLWRKVTQFLKPHASTSTWVYNRVPASRSDILLVSRALLSISASMLIISLSGLHSGSKNLRSPLLLDCLVVVSLFSWCLWVSCMDFSWTFRTWCCFGPGMVTFGLDFQSISSPNVFFTFSVFSKCSF